MEIKIESNCRVFFINKSGKLADSSDLMKLAFEMMIGQFVNTANEPRFISEVDLVFLSEIPTPKIVFVVEDCECFARMAATKSM